MDEDYTGWNSYKRKQANIEKAVYNSEVNRLLQLHYKYLHSKLVHSEKDEGIFNDTYLKLTHTYDSSKDFIGQYIHTFYNLRYAYEQDDKTANYHIQLVEVYDKVDTVSISDTISNSEDKTPVKGDKTKLTELKSQIQSYAISKKAYKRKKSTV